MLFVVQSDSVVFSKIFICLPQSAFLNCLSPNDTIPYIDLEAWLTDFLNNFLLLVSNCREALLCHAELA